ncbi:hypothetical protein IKN40_04910 [bacterium]|nr:hypothetical protein [bacterium]
MEKQKFNKGDIIRNKKDSSQIFYVEDVKYNKDVDDCGIYLETYEWYDYFLWSIKDNCQIDIQSYNDNEYDVIMHRFIFEDIQPFMKVLVYNVLTNQWVADMISSWGPWNIHTIGLGEFTYKEVIPYNENTKDLINTSLMQTIYHNFSTVAEIIYFATNNDLSNINLYKQII